MLFALAYRFADFYCRICGGYCSGSAVEEAKLHLAFQDLNMFSNCRARHVQLLGGFGETAFLEDSSKDMERGLYEHLINFIFIIFKPRAYL